MKKILLLVLMACLFGIHESFADAVTEKYMLVISKGSVLSETNAKNWFTNRYGDKGVVKTATEFVDAFNNRTIDPAEYQVIWVHIDQDKDATPDMTDFADVADELETYSKAGGSLLLTLHASDLLGQTYGISRINDKYRANLTRYHGGGGDVSGIHINENNHRDLNHAIFQELTGNNYKYSLVTQSSENLHECLWDFNSAAQRGSFDANLSTYESTTTSKVLGTWTHVNDAAVGGIIEYEQTWNGSTGFKGTSIAIGMGCYAWDADAENQTVCGETTNIAKLTENCIAYLDEQNINEAPVDPNTYCQTKYVLLLKAEYTHDDEEENTGLTPDEKAAADWFYANYADVPDEVTGYPKGQIITASELGSTVNITPAITKVVWAHLDNTRYGTAADAQAYIATAFGTTAIEALKDYVLAGGNLYASNYATELVASIGRIPTAYQPNLLNEEDANNKKGINPAIGCAAGLQLFDHQYHPIYNNLTSTDPDGHISYNFLSTATTAGTGLMWKFNPMIKSDNADPYTMVDFEIMTNSIVLGTWEHVTDYYCGGLIEFLPIANPTGSSDSFKGRIIANGLGGYDWDSSDKEQSSVTGVSNIELLTQNTLEYLATQKLRKVAYLLPENLDQNDPAKDEPLEVVDQDDERTALEWFISDLVNTNQGAILQPKDLANLDPTEYTTMWIHIDRDGESALFDHWGLLDDANSVTMLTRYAKNGGNLLLTKHAIQLVASKTYVNKSYEGNILKANDINSMKRCSAGTDNHYALIVQNTVGKPNNTHRWVINPVIGAGRMNTDPVTYVRYLNNVKQDGSPTPHRDNFKHHIYYNMVASFDHPINDAQQPIDAGNSYGVYTILGATETNKVKEDHNCGWLFDETYNIYDSANDYITAFEDDNKCTVLGQWGHKSALDNAMVVQFNKTGNWNDNEWEGNIFCFGLGAYEWQPSKTDGSANRNETNSYIGNIKQLTLNALNVLENDMGDAETTTFEVGNVKYTGWNNGVQHVATILSADPSLQVYDLTKKPEGSKLGNGQITDPAPGGLTYDITGIGVGAFTGCTSLAYADLMAFKGVMPEDVRNRFPAWTLIYLPQEQYAASLATCPIKGENIVNTLTNGTKVSEKLKLFDNEYGTTVTDATFHYYANKYEFTASAVEFNRSFSAYKSTVILPFVIDTPSDFGTFYAFDKVDGDDIRFVPVSSTEANKPYMFAPKEAGTTILINNTEKVISTMDDPIFSTETQTYSLTSPLEQKQYENTEATNNGGNFIGLYRDVLFNPANSSNVYAYNSTGVFKTSTGRIWADPFRAYIQLNAAPSNPAKVFNAVFPDFAPTGITNTYTDNSTKDNTYYTLQGIKVTNPGPGIYIQNKRKVVIKK